MITKLSYALLFLFFGVTVAFSQPIKNGSFEEDGSWRFRNGWEKTCNMSRTGNCSAEYNTSTQKRTSIAFQFFSTKTDNICTLSVWLKTELQDAPFNADGSPSRNGVSVQLWNITNGRKIAVDLGRRHVYTDGCRGQCEVQDWTNYVADVDMPAGDWKVTLYMHPIRDRNVKPVRHPSGRAWVDDITMSRKVD